MKKRSPAAGGMSTYLKRSATQLADARWDLKITSNEIAQFADNN